ncbi:helix-turn-helix domain-containing protein [Virgibacillus flavescens]|uniref:helix-turn-helix domain-containing protein n=1 Tax=Virgibacillus flavescens TaxID=1611422 RepID=UPI003D32E624
MVLLMEIGTRLKEARVAQNLSLDSVQDTTKIQKRYLAAIEEGNFHVLPGKFYARAFIKEYAAAVGLDSNELLNEYKEEMPAEEEDNEQYTRIQRSRRDSNSSKGSKTFSVFPIIVVILLVVGIFFAAWYFISNSSSNNSSDPIDETDDTEIIIDNSKDSTPDKEQNSDQKNASDETSKEDEPSKEEGTTDPPPEEPESEKVEPTLELVETGTGGAPHTVELNNASEEVTVLLESEGKSYLDVLNGDEENYFSGEINEKNSPKEIDVTGDERIYFNVGYAPGLQITIDGVKLEYPIDPTEQMHQKIWVNINPAKE